MKASPPRGPVELDREKHARGLENLVRLAQLTVLAAQPAQLLQIAARRQITPGAGVGLSPAHPAAQRLRTDVQILGDLRDRPAAVKRRADRALLQLRGVLPSSSHMPSTSLLRTSVLF